MYLQGPLQYSTLMMRHEQCAYDMRRGQGAIIKSTVALGKEEFVGEAKAWHWAEPVGMWCMMKAHTATWFRGVLTRLQRRKLRSVGCVSDAPGIAMHSASALEGFDVAAANRYRVAAVRMANSARVLRALQQGGRFGGLDYT